MLGRKTSPSKTYISAQQQSKDEHGGARADQHTSLLPAIAFRVEAFVQRGHHRLDQRELGAEAERQQHEEEDGRPQLRPGHARHGVGVGDECQTGA